ncbi:S41 family peptidase [Flavobacterium selenitireducens]|uniref:S41 family peptidase n=1 Tax=Flavobacterium selenitireducens TaxID=2722704 RepID=UPI00168ACFC9|nr:S41 family peptidase [Flavobacterium selenitireducens]MBD3582690.1 hypothetical protein [Flavobacterium selenitireducens]
MKSIIITALALCCFPVFPQSVGRDEKSETIRKLGTTLSEKYYSESEGKRLHAFLAKQSKNGAYDKIGDGQAFASILTRQLQSQVADRHLRVEYSQTVLPADNRTEIMSLPEQEKQGYANMLRHTNYAIRKVEVLTGNVGYIDFEAFVDPEFASTTYAGMMAYLSHTEALIIDLRHCGGSRSPEAVPFLLSYFFSKPVKLEEIFWRKKNGTTVSWTSAAVPGRKYLDKPVFVLTSRNTFSGAEAFVAGMKKYKRATIIGQTTGGGSHPGGIVRLSDHFQAYISVGKIVGDENAVSDWETHGIAPDIAIKTKLALIEARQLAMRTIASKSDEEIWKNALLQWCGELEKTKPTFKKVTLELANHHDAKEVRVAGTFNDWTSEAMQKTAKGWVVDLESETGRQRYKFIVDGKWIVDPDNRETEISHGNVDSVVEVN